MDIVKLFNKIQAQGIDLILKGTEISIQSNSEIPAEIIELLKNHKDAMSDYLREISCETSQGALILLNDGHHKNDLYFIHPIGGTTTCYWDLIQHLSLPMNVYAIQASGIDEMQASLPSSVEAMARSYISAMLNDASKTPIHMCGWSFGGVVALEIAIQLSNAGYPVASLSLIDTNLESLTTSSPLDTKGLMLAFVRDLFANDQDISCIATEIYQSTKGLDINYLFQLCNRYHLVPENMGLQMFHRLFLVFSNNTSIHKHYVPSYFPGKIHHFVAEESLERNLVQETNAWLSKYACEELLESTIQGNHYSLIKMPNILGLASKINTSINTLNTN